MPALVLTIGGVERQGLLRRSSLSVPSQLQQRGTCKFTLDDEPLSGAGYHPVEGQQVVATYDGEVVFAGTVDDVTWWVENGTDPHVTVSDVSCVDYNQIADRHLVARSYGAMLAGDIIRDIVARDLAGEGITVVGPALTSSGSEVGPSAFVGSAVVGTMTYGGVEDGPLIETATFTYMPASQAFTELAELIGFYWNIGPDKVLTFAPREQRVAPFAISEAADTDPITGDARSNFRAMKATRSRGQYRNRQYLRAGTDVTDPRTESFKGDGATKTFLTGFPLALVPTVTVNGVPQTVGIKGLDATGSHQWYWNKGENMVAMDDGAAPLLTADTLAVTYQGTFPIVIASSSQGEVEARQAVEGGTGVYEDVVDDASIESVELAHDKAGALLRRYGVIPEEITFETDQPGLKAGQLLTIWSPRHKVDGAYLIDSATYADVGVGDQFLRCTVKAISGERMDTWVDFFRKVVQQGRRFVLRENERLSLGRTVADIIGVHDTLQIVQNATTDAYVGSAVVGFSGVTGTPAPAVTGSVVGVAEVGTAVTGSG